jgi:hypothetical protein
MNPAILVLNYAKASTFFACFPLEPAYAPWAFAEFLAYCADQREPFRLPFGHLLAFALGADCGFKPGGCTPKFAIKYSFQSRITLFP